MTSNRTEIIIDTYEKSYRVICFIRSIAIYLSSVALMIFGSVSFYFLYSRQEPQNTSALTLELIISLLIIAFGLILLLKEPSRINAPSNEQENRNGIGNTTSPDDLYEYKFVEWVNTVKISAQFLIGASLIVILLLKGILELCETLELCKGLFSINDLRDINLFAHLLNINTFAYIGAALAISAGLDLGYMLFTKGPDEAIGPLLLAITSAGFYTLSKNPNGSWVLGVYALSILVLMYSIKKYHDWEIEKH